MKAIQSDDVIEGVRRATVNWLFDHPISIQTCVETGVQNAVERWLNLHGEDLVRAAMQDVIEKRTQPPF